jgi:hypothetical protein
LPTGPDEYRKPGEGCDEGENVEEDEVHGLLQYAREGIVEQTSHHETKAYRKDAGTQHQHGLQALFPVPRPTRRLVRHTGKVAFVRCHRASTTQ